jgi:hypothetical protein
LPWCDLLETKDGAKPDLKFLLKEWLDLKFTRRLLNIVPRELTDCLKYVLSMSFDEVPDYAYLKTTLTKIACNYILDAIV